VRMGCQSCLRVDLYILHHFPLSGAVFPSCPYSSSPIVVVSLPNSRSVIVSPPPVFSPHVVCVAITQYIYRSNL
jgi:hypothetical protein